MEGAQSASKGSARLARVMYVLALCTKCTDHDECGDVSEAEEGGREERKALNVRAKQLRLPCQTE